MHCTQVGLGESLICTEFLGAGQGERARLLYIFAMSKKRSVRNFGITARAIYFCFLQKPAFTHESRLVCLYVGEKLCNHPRHKEILQ